MKSKLIRSAIVFFLAFGINLMAADVELAQLHLKDPTTNATISYSHVGEVKFHFSDSDDQFLVANGGAYLNVILSNNVSGGDQWVVQNLYYAFPSVNHLLGSHPAVLFGMGPDGTPWTGAKIEVFVSKQPRKSVRSRSPYRIPTLYKTFANSGRFNPFAPKANDGSGIAGQNVNGPFVGQNPDATGQPVANGANQIPPDQIPPVNEGPNQCAPGSVARSIAYMAAQNGVDVGDVNKLKDKLAECMMTDPKTGTTDDNMLAGKNKVVEMLGLPIESDIDYSEPGASIEEVIEKLNGGGDVEILISWDPKGGHAAMVTGVTILPDGTIQITYVDDADQTDGQAANDVHTINVDPSTGKFNGGTVDGFFIECWTGGDGGDGGSDGVTVIRIGGPEIR